MGNHYIPLLTSSKLKFCFYQFQSSELSIHIKMDILYYHPPNEWLLGATNGNQGCTTIKFDIRDPLIMCYSSNLQVFMTIIKKVTFVKFAL